VSGAFANILQHMVERVPGALGAIFADWEGEAVDQFAHISTLDIQLAGAHWGVVLTLASARLRAAGAGAIEEMWIEGEHNLVLVRQVTARYFVVLTARRGVHLATARRELQRSAETLLGEM
jgi:predicted regulator of Ras-like GTPase activity (Roadblock/LC7/MglB family)